MQSKLSSFNIDFRPHFKTHNSLEVASWFKEFGINKCTVSSVEMAEKFASAGWNDITIAFPVNILEIAEINYLNSRIKLNLLIDNINTAVFLENNLNKNTNIYLKINTGKNRAGRNIEDVNLVKPILDYIKHSNKLNFEGILTHTGQTYNAHNPDEIKTQTNIGIAKMRAAKNHCLEYFDFCKISIGDTPGMVVNDSFPEVDEARPGVFVYYDLMMKQLGVCEEYQIASYVAAPICGIYPERKENNLLIYCGSVHLSKDSIEINNKSIYGKLKLLNELYINSDFNEEIYIDSLSQEHALCTVPEDLLKQLKIGELVGILPVHACLTANILDNQFVLVS
jgi:D-serine deaminase-like pyridoxal phosphate-dependent protein